MPMKSVYRQPLTPGVIKKIEKGTLDYYDDELYNNINTGTLEQYLDEKTRVDGFQESVWRWKSVAFGMFIGYLFTIISLYMSLKVGFAVGGGGMIIYFVSLAYKWSPTELVITQSASGGSLTWGFLWIFPAIYLLMGHPNYAIGEGEYLITEAMIPPFFVVMVCATLGGWLGVLYFTLLRRVWILEDPLPFPGIEAGIKKLEINKNLSRGSMKQAIQMLKTLFTWACVAMVFTILRDVRIANNKSAMDNLLGGDFYRNGMVMHPHSTYTFFGWSLIPMEISLGWFMRFRLAFLVASGSMFTWFVIVPLAVGFNVPIWIPKVGEYYAVRSFPLITSEWEVNQAPAFVAASRVAYPITVGALLGAGITAIIKMARIFKTIIADMFTLGRVSEERPEYIKGRGWYEWPKIHLFFMWFLVIFSVTILFTVFGDFPLIESLIVGVLLVTLGLILTVIAVKILGEVNFTPSSGLSFIMLITFIVIFRIIGTDTPTMIIMALLGATIFCVILQSAAGITGSFKTSSYIGVRPYHITKAKLIAIPFGIIITVFGAMILSAGLSTVDPETGEPVLDLAAPQAHAFATFIQIILGEAPWDWLLIGICLGVFMELLTGMGTAFALGMYLPFSLTINLIIGGVLREWWQRRRLEPKAKRLGWTEQEKSQKLQHTFLIFAGLGTGEGIIGAILAFYYVIPLIT